MIVHSQALTSIIKMVREPGPIKIEFDEANRVLIVQEFNLHYLRWDDLGMIPVDYKKPTRNRSKTTNKDGADEGAISDPRQTDLTATPPQAQEAKQPEEAATDPSHAKTTPRRRR